MRWPYVCRLYINSLLFYNTRKRQIFTILKWLMSSYPDSPFEDVIQGKEYIERVTAHWHGYPKRTADEVSIFCDSSGHEIRISFWHRSSKATVPEAEARLIILEGKDWLYAKKLTHEDHEELAFMLKFLGLFALMHHFEESYFSELHLLEKRIIALEKSYASLDR